MLDKKYNAKEKEDFWKNKWQEDNIYKFNEELARENKENVFSVDTPPPTVSGNIHIGHIFSYSQTEMLTRYKRLMGNNIFYPFGFDDNGLPSERLVEKKLKKKAHQIGREEFSKECYDLTNEYEEKYKELFMSMGFGVDWSLKYKTISPKTIKISQWSFLDLVKKGKCYHKEAPALWCHECLTSIAQAELETKTVETTFNHIKFKVNNEDDEFVIATTRPELLPAIVAVFVNPKDQKNARLVGKEAYIPVIDKIVPIIADEKVDIEKGSGIVMCCTFGDQTDIYWWEKYKLPLVDIFESYGIVKKDVNIIGGLKILDAREKMKEELKKVGAFIKEETISHEIQTHERCGNPIEYRVTKQWFIDLLNGKEDFLKIGKEINWHPEYMQKRYNEWVENIAWDWCISRQRYFGVPFPVWHCKKCGKPVFAREEDLPVNPITDKPHIEKCSCGFTEFIPEMDVMDTWATSSITPLINKKYCDENNFNEVLSPMTLRANASDIIRTWDFYTIAKNFYHFGEKPWKDVMISGFVMAGKGEKISKSKNNASFTPESILEKYSADLFRYWAGTGRLGTDIIFSEETIERGKKLINKIYNVAKFVEIHLDDYEEKCILYNDGLEIPFELEFFDKWIFGKFYQMEKMCLKYMETFEVGLALNVLEKFFWNFCDNYIEIVKHRLYRPEEFSYVSRFSGQYTVREILIRLLKLFSIFFPFVTEEIYEKMFNDLYKRDRSIHLSRYFEFEKDFELKNELENGEELIEILSIVRGEKTKSGVSLKTEVKNLNLKLDNKLQDSLKIAEADFKAALNITNLNIEKIEDVQENNVRYLVEKIELNKEI